MLVQTFVSYYKFPHPTKENSFLEITVTETIYTFLV